MRDALASLQSILVLGGSSDIARATVARLVEDGRVERVVLAGRPGPRLDGAADELRGGGRPGLDVTTLPFDATDLDSHEAFVKEAFAGGDVDLVLVAFGLLGDTPSVDLDRRATLDVVTTNYLGAVSTLVPLADRLRAQGHGTIVVLSSVAAERPRRSNFVYGSAKAGLDAFAHGLGELLRGSGVEVLVVRPGFVKTRMTEGRRPAPLSTTPDVVAGVIARGLERRATTVWAPPPVRWLMAVLRHLPAVVFRRLPG